MRVAVVVSSLFLLNCGGIQVASVKPSQSVAGPDANNRFRLLGRRA